MTLSAKQYTHNNKAQIPISHLFNLQCGLHCGSVSHLLSESAIGRGCLLRGGHLGPDGLGGGG